MRAISIACALSLLACGDPEPTPVASSAPAPVQLAPHPPAQLALSDVESCVIVGADVVCWGRGAPPHVEQALAGSIALGGHGDLLCGIDAAGSVHCPRVPGRDGTVADGVAIEVDRDTFVVRTSDGSFFEGLGTTALDPTSGVASVTPGASCRLRTEGYVTCGGPDHPVRIDDARDLAFRGSSLCVLTSDAIECATLEARETHGPVERIAAADGERIVAGLEHVCILGGGRVRCAGANRFGELGQGHRDSVTGLVDVAGPSDVIEIAASGHRTCARSAVATWCWGADGRAQSSGERQAIVTVDLAPATALFAGPTQMWALADGAAWSWGEGKGGQLGDGLARAQPTPIAPSLPGIGDITEIAAGFESTCVLYDGGHVACFGAGPSWGGEIDPSALHAIEDATHIAGVGRSLVVAHADRRVEAFEMWSGRPSEGRRALPSGTVPSEIVQLVAGDTAACARTRDGRVYCWGGDFGGECGDGGDGVVSEPTAVVSAIPMPPPGDAREHLYEGCEGARCGGPMTGVRWLASRGSTTCAVLANGRVACWGSDDAGRFADDVRFSRRPVLVEGIEHAQAACVGERHLCALHEDGLVSCRGSGSAGVASSAAVATLDQIVELACGAEHACARRTDGSVRCWGADRAGVLGSSSLIRASAVRVAMPR